ncbi:Spore coat associated protein JA (CotJA) [uncultured Clostridium sp.]|nr:Spore coat associated protein JA (CotJA) [uncultured Clostridium sp.]
MADYRNQNSLRCSCMLDPLRGLGLAIAYVPWQYWDQTYELEKALQWGTIFPELNKPFSGKRGGCR